MMVCYTEKQVSEMIGISQIKLKTDRMKLQGIPFVKIGRSVRYRDTDVEAYLAANSESPEGYLKPGIQEAGSDSTPRPGKAEKTTSPPDKPRSTDWKSQALDILISHGIISRRFTGRIILEIEDGKLKTAEKREEL